MRLDAWDFVRNKQHENFTARKGPKGSNTSILIDVLLKMSWNQISETDIRIPSKEENIITVFLASGSA